MTLYGSWSSSCHISIVSKSFSKFLLLPPHGAVNIDVNNIVLLPTGSASAEGSPLVFSLDSITPEPDEDKQRNALVYIASLPT